MEELRFFCITWNVQTTWPDSVQQDFLSLLKLNEPVVLPDIFVICLQEVQSQPQNILLDSVFENPWSTVFREILSQYGFIKIIGEKLQGILVSIFIKKVHFANVRDLKSSFTRTGLAGFWGNKGGVVIRFSLYGCSICIVNCHLAPHDDGFEDRISTYNAIVDQTIFNISPTTNILYHDYVFWIGDLNFRLAGDQSGEEIVEDVNKKSFDSLLMKDELKMAQNKGLAFESFVEGNITFPPTYKFLTYSQEYDLSRRPAWTDRILHQVHVNAYDNVKLGVKQLHYDYVPEYSQSDHKPVVSVYAIKVFKNYADRWVKFAPIDSWSMGLPHIVKYVVSCDVVVDAWDYIAVFKSDFSSTEQYITYMYVKQDFRSPNGDVQSGTERNFQIILGDDSIQASKFYVLAYYSAKYTSYLGISEPFVVHGSQVSIPMQRTSQFGRTVRTLT